MTEPNDAKSSNLNTEQTIESKKVEPSSYIRLFDYLAWTILKRQNF